MHFAVIGDGAMGTACAFLLCQKDNHRVTLWCRTAEQATRLNEDRENKRYLPGAPLPLNTAVTSEFADVVEADVYVLAVPTVYLSATLAGLASQWPAYKPVISVIKGIEQATFRRPCQIIADQLGVTQLVCLSGPSHAEEIVRRLPASVVAASAHAHLAAQAQSWFSTPRFRVYTSTDLVGCEIGGALKNVIAVAAGICDGMGLGDNAKAALMTRGLAEIRRVGKELGGERSTFQGLAGLGDLITTCVSPHGRNRRVGECIGQGRPLAEALDAAGGVAEGVWTARGVYQLALVRQLDLPVTTEVYRILFEDKSPHLAVDDLMNRELKAEDWLDG